METSQKPNPLLSFSSFLHAHCNRFASDLSARFEDTKRFAESLTTRRFSPPPPFASVSQSSKPSSTTATLNPSHVAKALAGTSVFTVSNTNNEFVLISDPTGDKSIGLLCFRQEDAEAFLAQARLRRRELKANAKVVPINLDQVYLLKVEGISFRFLPDPIQIKNALELKSSSSKNGFDGVPVFQTGIEQEEHINSDIDTDSGQLPVISPTSKGPIREGKYPIGVFKKMRGQISINDLDRKADVEMISSGSRKRIGETNKKKALSLAKRAISPKGFLVVMKRSHVTSKCYLNTPVQWSTRYMSPESQDVVMQVDQTKWQLKFSFYGSSGRGGISTGWKIFVRDNNLCEGDVCVFEPAKKPEGKPFLLDVYIFRAAEAETSKNG